MMVVYHLAGLYFFNGFRKANIFVCVCVFVRVYSLLFPISRRSDDPRDRRNNFSAIVLNFVGYFDKSWLLSCEVT